MIVVVLTLFPCFYLLLFAATEGKADQGLVDLVDDGLRARRSVL